ncbi:hypothetical protein GJ688_17620 [Heliobacillus mobilis]|uniref:Copper amine oxidase-like N-terminal domain-containing protein n=1 Tax=Heliobacterium mobile TaxID=28064 RepID=A0A6I3SNZ1_HELMO|nr:copper amine oxidase N-terminal domain-containing protein [Heliobacterium mobile]MTV50754.1 hypothetical protein [Heliobacterium mobile]
MNRKKWMSLVLITSIAASLIPWSAAFAKDEDMYSVLVKGSPKPGGFFDARIAVEVPQGAMDNSVESFRIIMPKKAAIGNIGVTAPEKVESADNQFLNPDSEEIEEGKEYVIEVEKNEESTGKGLLYVQLHDIEAPSSLSGELKVTIEAESGSVFENAQLTLATIGNGSVAVTIDDVKTFDSNGGKIDTIRIKESRPGALEGGYDDSLKLKLPQGYRWDVSDDVEVEANWGDIVLGEQDGDHDDADPPTRAVLDGSADDGRTLKLRVNRETERKGAYITLSNLGIEIDESTAKPGDIVVTIGGKSDPSPERLTVAKYGEYKLKGGPVGELPTLVAGQLDQNIVVFLGEEETPGAIAKNRAITVTTPENVKWRDVPNVNRSESDLGDILLLKPINSQHDLFEYVNEERRMIRGVFVSSTKTKPAKVYFEKATVDVAPNFQGLLAITFGGETPLKGPMPVAKVTPSVVMKPLSVTEVKIGLPNQAIGDVIVAESKAEALMSKATRELRIYAPAGVDFERAPKFEVIEGDLVLENDSATTKTDMNEGQKYACVKVKSTSTKPSKIKVSNIQVNVDRTVPEGDLTFKIKGWETATAEMAGDLFSDSTAAQAVVAKVVTPAPSEQKGRFVFTINQTKAMVASKEVTMDIAPYIKDNRTFLPIRYVAQALGLKESETLWDDESKTFTMIQGPKIVQFQIDSPILKINGTGLTMDACPEMIEPGRMMVPLRWIGNVLGGSIQWDEATQTITIN